MPGSWPGLASQGSTPLSFHYLSYSFSHIRASNLITELLRHWVMLARSLHAVASHTMGSTHSECPAAPTYAMAHCQAVPQEMSPVCVAPTIAVVISLCPVSKYAFHALYYLSRLTLGIIDHISRRDDVFHQPNSSTSVSTLSSAKLYCE